MSDRVLSLAYRRKSNPFQRAVHDDIETFILLGQGGYGSGKTFAGAMKALHLSYLNPKARGGLLVPSYTEFKMDWLPTFETILEENRIEFSYNKNDHMFRFPWTNQPTLVFTGEKRLRGPNIGWAIVNEFSLMPYERIKELIGRVRIKCPYPQIVMLGTPDDQFGWYDEFVDNQKKAKPKNNRPRFRMIQGKTQDNKYNDPDYVETLEASYDPKMVRLFVYGEKVDLNEAAFYYSFNEGKHVAHVERDPALPVHVACDFNVGNMHAICANIAPENPRQVRVFDEIVLTDQGSDTNEMAKAITTRFGDGAIVTCDASGKARKTTGKSDIDILRGAGLHVRFKSSNPRLRYRQLLVNGLFAHNRIIISRNCPVLKRDLTRVSQNRATFDKIDKDPKLTHASDCLDYLCDHEFELNTKRRQFMQKKL